MKKKGGITLEAAIIIPIVLIVTFVMLYFLMIHYERVVLGTYCQKYAEEIANYSNYKYVEKKHSQEIVRDKKRSLKAKNSKKFLYFPYWRINRKAYFPSERKADKDLSKKMILDGEAKFEVKSETRFLNTYVVVTVEKSIKQLAPLLNMLGVKDGNIIIKNSARVIVKDQAEMIRNVQLLKDSLKKFGGVDIDAWTKDLNAKLGN